MSSNPRKSGLRRQTVELGRRGERYSLLHRRRDCIPSCKAGVYARCHSTRPLNGREMSARSLELSVRGPSSHWGLLAF